MAQALTGGAIVNTATPYSWVTTAALAPSTSSSGMYSTKAIPAGLYEFTAGGIILISGASDGQLNLNFNSIAAAPITIDRVALFAGASTSSSTSVVNARYTLRTSTTLTTSTMLTISESGLLLGDSYSTSIIGALRVSKAGNLRCFFSTTASTTLAEGAYCALRRLA